MLGTVLGARDIAVNKRVKSLPLECYILVGKINKIERMSADDKYDGEIKSGKGGGELGVRGTCYFSKVVRGGLTEKVTRRRSLKELREQTAGCVEGKCSREQRVPRPWGENTKQT